MSSSMPRAGQTTLYTALLTRRSLLALTALGVTAGGKHAVAGSPAQLTCRRARVAWRPHRSNQERPPDRHALHTDTACTTLW